MAPTTTKASTTEAPTNIASISARPNYKLRGAFVGLVVALVVFAAAM
jgi:hypothetical protein